MGRTRVWLTSVSFAILLPLLTVQISYACSAGEDFDPVAQSDVIISGRVVGWQPLVTNPDVNDFIPIQITLDIDRTYKSSMSGQVSVIDVASRQAISSTEAIWVGGAGPCGAFSEDPTHSYVILGLTRQRDGAYHSDRPRTFFQGAAPHGDAYQAALQRIQALAPHQLPVTSSSGTTRTRTSDITFDILLIGLGAISIGGGLRLWIRAQHARNN